MSDTTSMTLRIDTELKAAAERAADGSGITLTEFVTRALKGAANPVCTVCGRSSPNARLPSAFTPAFEQFYGLLCGPKVNSPFVLFTLEGTQSKVYWGRLPNNRPLAEETGTIEIDAFFSWGDVEEPGRLPSGEIYRIAIPRGSIQGWQFDPTGETYRAQYMLGYADGNEPARRAAQMGRRGSR